jgi:hypothetical protein
VTWTVEIEPAWVSWCQSVGHDYSAALRLHKWIKAFEADGPPEGRERVPNYDNYWVSRVPDGEADDDRLTIYARYFVHEVEQLAIVVTFRTPPSQLEH